MSTYDLAFATKFAEIAEGQVAGGLEDIATRRAVAYISRLSMELTLKAILEQVGLPVNEIKKHWHNLRTLLAEVDKCEVEVEIKPESSKWVPASRLRAIEVNFLGYSTTAGAVLEAENYGASKYPDEIRYGAVPQDFPPESLAKGASVIAEWAKANWHLVRKP